MAHRCPNCGASNSKNAKRCTECNFPFGYLAWFSENGLEASVRGGVIASIIIAAVTFPVIIGTLMILLGGLGFQWIALAIAVSIIDAVVIFALKDRLMRLGWIGPYRKRDWQRE